MTRPSSLADCCPQCFPGDHEAVLPSTVAPDGTSLLAVYRCPSCGHFWHCWWDPQASGWPLAAVPQPPARSLPGFTAVPEIQ